MANTALITIFCPDRPGLIAAISGRLFDLGANLGDTSFAVLGGGAEFATVCELPKDVSLETVERDLGQLPELDGAQLTVAPFGLSKTHAASANITHRMEISGADSPGLVARLSEVFAGFRANIVRLNAQQTHTGQYWLNLAVWIPPEKAEACLATVANTAGELKLDLRWEPA